MTETVDDHVEPAGRRAAPRHGRARRCPGSTCASVDDADLPVAADGVGAVEVRGPERVRRATGGGPSCGHRVHRRRLVPHRRPRPLRRRRLPHHRRPLEGPRHLRRAQRVPEGGRGRPRRAAGVSRVGGGRACPTPTSARRSWRSSCAEPGAALSSTGRCAGRVRAHLAAFKVPKPGPASSRRCPATPWARSRRRACARCSAAEPDRRRRAPSTAQPGQSGSGLAKLRHSGESR